MNMEKLLPVGSKRRNFARKIYNKYFARYNEEERIYKKWIKQNEPNKRELEEQRKKVFEIHPKISIVVPIYNTPERFFKELVKSLQNQTYSNWELCLADGSPNPLYFVQKIAKKDNRIKYKIIGENKGISGNTNEAISLATGDFIALLDHDDLLPAFSLYEIVKTINQNPKVQFIYTDEDKLETAKGPRYGVFFKPDFSPYTLNSANYICHFSIFKKDLMEKLGGLKSEYDGSQDFDIVARTSEITKDIVHIPKVCYHWRAHKNSTAQNSDSKPYAFEVGKKVIKDHIKRSLDTDVEVTDGLTPGSYEIKYLLKKEPKVSIIVDGRKCFENDIEQLIGIIRSNTCYKNYEIIAITNKNVSNVAQIIRPSNDVFKDYNNAVIQSDGEYFIIFDDNLLQIDKPTYIEDLLGICQDKNVGIVGTKLYNRDEKVEHCGIILGMNGAGDFLYKGAPKDIGTYMQRLLIIHNVSCVYIKYAMINKKIFLQTGEFSDEFREIAESIDTCLKILSSNKQVVINPIITFKVRKLSQIQKLAVEEIKIKKKWENEYKKGDIYFSPNLSKKDTGLSLNI